MNISDIANFGESGKLALSHAERMAKETRHDDIGAEHVFLGVAQLEDVNIRRQLQKTGVDIDEVSRAIRNGIKTGTAAAGRPLTLSPEAKRAVDAAKREARALGQDKIEAPHILLGLLEDETGLSARALKNAGADLAQAAENLRGMLRKGEWKPEFYDGRKAVEQPGIDKTSEIVKDLGRDLTADAEQGLFDPIIGREDEILAMMKILTGRRKNNPILVGDAGVGKTAVVEGLAQVIVSEGVMPELKGKRIRTVEMVAVVAGAQLLGQFEQKLQTLIKEAETDPHLILFIDEIHTLMGARGGAMGAADILKPALSRGKMKCIGATTQEEYRKHFEKDKALARRFQPVFVDEPTKEETLEILWGLRPKYEEFHGAKILDEAVQGAVDLSARYIGDRRMPDKAIDVIDQACSNKKLRMFYGLSDLGELTRQERRDLFSGKKGAPAAGTSMIIAFEDVARIVAEWTGIPVGKLKETESLKLLDLEALVGKKIVGQDEAVKAIAQSIRTSRSGMGDPKRPMGSFLFLGPTGVGKTELAKTLAGILFDDEERLIQIDMSEFYEKHTISRLTGSPPGYVDSDQGGQLTEAVKKQPYAVVLFDEIEKAHPDVLRILLQILEEGRLTDGLGRSVNFRNTVIVMTSNVGSDRISEHRPFGVDLRSKEARDKGSSLSDIRGDIEKELRRRFSPEFMNRIDEVVLFNPLSRENLRNIAKVMLAKIPIKVEADEEALELLVNARYDPAMGARPLRRTIEDLVVEPLANEIIGGKISEHDTVRLGASEGRLTFRRIPAEPDPTAKTCPAKGCGAVNAGSAKRCQKCGRELD
ncbi:MAG TPA: ATP-dependent Clp protease ATP-binding subunit [Acidobacteriota bacterium]|nr:ATP-dependent Clp protease ATP-binding subunit [Acidobacteriota bacterium]